uniref:Protein kinase domain-containing protein n=1 Tax=Brassica oleracea var. oleracea TaxID=109376 RepID=A0A0D3AR48_BRAOL
MQSGVVAGDYRLEEERKTHGCPRPQLNQPIGDIRFATSSVFVLKLEKVGEGTYGKVYRSREKATGKTRLHGDEEGVLSTTLRKISILRMLACDPHIVRLMDVKQGLSKDGKTVLYLVFEYMDTDVKKDLKPHNLLMDPKTMRLKIADLGLARAFTLPMKKWVLNARSSIFRKSTRTYLVSGIL